MFSVFAVQSLVSNEYQYHMIWLTPKDKLERLTYNLSQSDLSLALLSILNMKFDSSLCVIGLLCSSFVAINAATHCRSMSSPLGDDSKPHVKLGNVLAARILV